MIIVIKHMCTLMTVYISGLNEHVNKMHKQLTRYRCETCGKGCIDRSRYYDHVSAHTGVKQYACIDTGVKLVQKASLFVLYTTIMLRLIQESIERRRGPVVGRSLWTRPARVQSPGWDIIRCKNLALYIRDCESLCLSDETLKAIGPFYMVSMPGEVKYPTQGVNV